MSDPEQLIQNEEQDAVPELPLGPSVLGAYGNVAFHNATHSPEHSPQLSHHRPAQLRNNSGSHVDVGFFDPEGVGELRRTLSRVSAAASTTAPKPENGISSMSEATLDGSFDFEKVLRDIMRQ